MGHSRIAVIALCAAALGLAGCGGGDDDGDDPDRAATPAANGSPAEPGATAEPEETAATTPEAVARETVDARGSGETTVDIEVVGLKVSGQLATLTLQYTAHDPEATEDTQYRLVDLHGGRRLFVTLVDPVNLKRYHVVEDTSGEPLEATDISVDVPVDSPTTAEYTFAAPPAGVEKIDVSVGDWPTLRDVPIER